jgi:hypothetical protein
MQRVAENAGVTDTATAAGLILHSVPTQRYFNTRSLFWPFNITSSYAIWRYLVLFIRRTISVTFLPFFRGNQ